MYMHDNIVVRVSQAIYDDPIVDLAIGFVSLLPSRFFFILSPLGVLVWHELSNSM